MDEEVGQEEEKDETLREDDDVDLVATIWPPPDEDVFVERPPSPMSYSEVFENGPERESARWRLPERPNGAGRLPASLLPQASAAGTAHAAARRLRAWGRDEAIQTESQPRVGGSGPLPPPALATVPPKVDCCTESDLPTAPTSWALPLDADAPYLSAAMRYVAAGRLDQAFQCVFRFGNEKTLCGVLRRLRPELTWQGLSEEEARYLAGLIVKVVCKDPKGVPARDACVWLESLLHLAGGRALVCIEDLPFLQDALFSLSGATGEVGLLASSLYYQLLQDESETYRWAGS